MNRPIALLKSTTDTAIRVEAEYINYTVLLPFVTFAMIANADGFKLHGAICDSSIKRQS